MFKICDINRKIFYEKTNKTPKMKSENFFKKGRSNELGWRSHKCDGVGEEFALNASPANSKL